MNDFLRYGGFDSYYYDSCRCSLISANTRVSSERRIKAVAATEAAKIDPIKFARGQLTQTKTPDSRSFKVFVYTTRARKSSTCTCAFTARLVKDSRFHSVHIHNVDVQASRPPSPLHYTEWITGSFSATPGDIL